MRWFRRGFDPLVRARGVARVLELATFAAIWPYVVGPLMGGWTQLDPVTAPLVSALALLVTLFLLCGVRSELETLPGQLGNSSLVAYADATKTLASSAALRAQLAATASGLPGRDVMKDVIERHDLSEEAGILCVVRFANHGPMVAFNAAGARRVTEAFGRRLQAAATRRPLAQLDDDSFGIWFASQTRQFVEAELGSIGYVLSQEIADVDLTVAPDIHVGLANFPGDADSASALISHAVSTAMPLKRFGAGAPLPERAASANLADRFAMEQALRRAVREGGLSLRYQPLINTAAGSVAGAEVLLRWRHPTFGDVSPALFVPILEATGLIHEIGLWTLNTACRQLRQWRETGQPGIRLAINLSAIQLQSPTLKSMIERTVASHGLAPSDIELELTETAAMEDRERTVTLFRELRERGFGIAIDDFGSGHSNFGYLKDLPFTKLKIDREFVEQVDTRSGSQAICKALVELGAGLGITVLAEGVERCEEVTALRRLGCQHFQGYFFARPLTAEDFTAKLGDADWLSTLGSEVRRTRAEVQKRMLS